MDILGRGAARVRIASWDLGRKMGWCFGDVASTPAYGSLELRKPGDPNALALGALARFLRNHVLRNGKDDLWICEKWLPPRQQKSGAAVEDSLRMNGVVNGIAGVYGIEIAEPYPATVRSQVCGKPHAGSREETKAMVIQAIVLRGIVPKNFSDNDACDAIAGWIWGSANFARRDSSFTLTAG